MTQPVLQIRNLNVDLWRGYLRTRIVRDVALDLAAGGILGLVGEYGAGKSMLGSAITGLIDLPLIRTSGEITLDGKRIDTLSPRRMADVRGAGIAMIFQDPLTLRNPVFTTGRQRVETMKRHTGLRGSKARDEAASLLEQLGIPAARERLANYPHEFSVGMRQRVVIALALAGRPKVIIADEPTTALDLSIQAQIINLLKRLCREQNRHRMISGTGADSRKFQAVHARTPRPVPSPPSAASLPAFRPPARC